MTYYRSTWVEPLRTDWLIDGTIHWCSGNIKVITDGEVTTIPVPIMQCRDWSAMSSWLPTITTPEPCTLADLLVLYYRAGYDSIQWLDSV